MSEFPGDCEQAICGGVNCMLTPDMFIQLSKARMVSPTGQCHTFSDKADGYTRGEGCGVVILKRLKDVSVNCSLRLSVCLIICIVTMLGLGGGGGGGFLESPRPSVCESGFVQKIFSEPLNLLKPDLAWQCMIVNRSVIRPKHN